MGLVLRLTSPDGEVTTVAVHGGEIVVGRAPSCGVVLHDQAISRRHARLYRAEDRWWVEDLGSRNGTLVDGVRTAGAAPLEVGTRITLGASELEVVAAEPEPAAGGGEPPSGKHTRLIAVRELLDAHLGADGARGGPEGADYRRLAERLRLLNEVHQALARPAASEELFELILDRVFEHLGPEEAAIYVHEAGGGHRCAASRSVTGATGRVLYSRSLLREVAGRGMAALVLDAETDTRFAGAHSLVTSGVRSLAAAPLLDAEDGPLGMIVIGSRLHRRRFDEGDLEVLASLASVAAMRIRNLRLAEEAAERRRLEREIALARRIQEDLLPSELPAPDGWALWGRTVPSRGVSGDMFTVTEREDGRLALLAADVSGKGIGAALLTASLEALTALPLREGAAPARVLGSVGRLLHERTAPERFATAFLAVVDPVSGTVRWANAGHPPALLLTADGGCRRLSATGRPLGLFPDAAYGEEETELVPGDTLVVYTDGYTEAAAGDEEFGLARFEALCRSAAGAPLEAFADAVDRAVEAFAPEGVHADDRTLVLLRRTR